jgi:adenylyltransferase/sulfurtransferase
LLKATVLVIGAGGLGCPILQYLAAAGVGTIGIVDDDAVSLSNLHRQILYTTSDIGFSKAEKAAECLRKLNPDINIIAINERLTTKNAWEIIAEYDIIMDGTDNFSSRYMINDACVLLNKPLIYGAVSKWEGQLAIFSDGVNYRDLFPVPPKENEVPNCATAGVLGVLPGIIGLMMAAEAIKLISGTGEPFTNRLLLYQLLNSQFHEMELQPDLNSRLSIPADRVAFEKMDYVAVCAPPINGIEIDHYSFDQLLEKEAMEVIDVREPGELPLITEFASRNIPLGSLAANAASIQPGTVVMICASGARSLMAAEQLVAASGNSKKVYSLKGGILEWKQAHSKQLQ